MDNMQQVAPCGRVQLQLQCDQISSKVAHVTPSIEGVSRWVQMLQVLTGLPGLFSSPA